MPPHFGLYCTIKWICQRYWKKTGALYNNILLGVFSRLQCGLVYKNICIYICEMVFYTTWGIKWGSFNAKYKKKSETLSQASEIQGHHFQNLTVMVWRHFRKHTHTRTHTEAPLSIHTSYKHGSAIWRPSSIKRYCLSSLESPNPLVSVVYSPGRCPALPV